MGDPFNDRKVLTNNWWGDPNGPYPNGQGDATGGGYYIPFATAPVANNCLGLAQVPPTPTPTPCSVIILTEYAAIPILESDTQAVAVQSFINNYGILQDGIVSRLELRRIRDYSLLILQNPDLRFWLDDHYPGFIFHSGDVETPILQNDNIANASFGNEQYWFVYSYGFLGCNTPAINIRQSDFQPQNSIPIANLYSLSINTALTSSNQIVNPPLDTALELNVYLAPYLRGLDEYTTAVVPCSNQGCRDQIYYRMLFDAQNRFDDNLIAQSALVPPLYLKILLMQESNLVPAFTPNGSGAAGIAQFTSTGAAEMVRLGRARDLTNVTNGTLYREYLDGIAASCISQLNGISQYPTSEASCVDFGETTRAISDAAFYLNSNYLYLRGIVNNSSSSIYPSWQLTSQASREQLLWLLSAAAYNAGPGTVSQSLDSAGTFLATNGHRALTIEILCPYLPEEAQRYVGSIRNGTPGAPNCDERGN